MTDRKKGSESKTTDRPNRVSRRKSMTGAGPLKVRDELKDPNYEYRFINDKDWNLTDKMERGWEFVLDPNNEMRIKNVSAEASDIGDRVAKSVGGGVTAYLMRIPKEFYEEDKAEKRRVNQELDDARPTSPHFYDRKFEQTKSGDID